MLSISGSVDQGISGISAPPDSPLNISNLLAAKTNMFSDWGRLEDLKIDFVVILFS